MLGLISNKKEYYYIAKWISNNDRNKKGYFRFKIIKDDDTRKIDVENMSGITGNATWETKSNIPFEPDDIIEFRGDRFNILVIDGNRKNGQESAFIWFNKNGNIPTTLIVRKAGI